MMIKNILWTRVTGKNKFQKMIVSKNKCVSSLRVSSEQYPVIVISRQVQQYFIFLYLFLSPSLFLSFLPPFLLSLFRLSSFSLVTTHYIFLVSFKATVRCRSREVKWETRMRKREWNEEEPRKMRERGRKWAGESEGGEGKKTYSIFFLFHISFSSSSIFLSSIFLLLPLSLSLFHTHSPSLFFRHSSSSTKFKQSKKVRKWMNDYCMKIIYVDKLVV